jgi:hypothetical protein
MLTLAVCLLASLVACGEESTLEPGDGSLVCGRPDLDPTDVAEYVARVMRELAFAPRYEDDERQAALNYLSAELAALGYSSSRQAFAEGANLVAEAPATTGTEKLVILGAHFDTVRASPGASDNASGVAAVLAVARYLPSVPCRSGPVLFAFFDKEEAGLLGSEAMAQMLDPNDVRAVHTVDQVVWDADGDRAFELERPTRTLETEWRQAAALFNVPLYVTDAASDHQSFREHGFPAVGLTEEFVSGDTTPFYHSSDDTYASVEAYVGYLALAARITAHVIVDEVSVDVPNTPE